MTNNLCFKGDKHQASVCNGKSQLLLPFLIFKFRK